MAHCPAYQGPICSLCCTLDARCGDLCKPHASLSAQWSGALRWLLPRRIWPYLDTGLGHFLLLMLVIVPLLAAVFGLLYHQELRAGAAATDAEMWAPGGRAALGLFKAYMALLLVPGMVAWWLVLAHKSRQVAQEESNRQTAPADARDRICTARPTRRCSRQSKHGGRAGQPGQEPLHQRHQPRAAHAAQQHPGLCAADGRRHRSMPAHRKQAVNVIKRGGEHLLSLIEGTLDIARIEAASSRWTSSPCALPTGARDGSMFELQARGQGLAFRFEPKGQLARGGACRRKAGAPDPDQPAGQCHQVHARGR
jgi:signal transduction histidine kinase